jgi:leader peptidase (prepilin peptidase)/N-methyltransferase
MIFVAARKFVVLAVHPFGAKQRLKAGTGILRSMLPVELVFSALFGLVFGSFLNVCIVRLPRGESIAHPRSHCRTCGTAIRSSDNVPLLSWLLLRGRSRCCGQSIPLQYPLVEAATAVLFVACAVWFGLGVEGAGMAALCWLLLGLAWMDAETYLLPDVFTLPGVALGLVYAGWNGSPVGWSVVHSLVSAAAIGGTLLAVSLLYRLIRRREGMGLGDVKLGAMLGAWLGWELASVALFLAVVTGAIAGIGWAASRQLQKDGNEKQAQPAEEPLRLPFGAFLASAGIVAVFTGKWLLAWYLRFFR